MSRVCSAPSVETLGRKLGGGVPIVMGILNVTPDSFSDGGLWLATDAAIEHGVHMHALGAAIVDVGGESTRPGARRVSPEEEWQRVGPVVKELVLSGVPVSIDTVNSQVARRAVEAGAILVNDVSGGSYDPAIAGVCATLGVAMVIQHWRGFPSDPNLNLEYEDVVKDVLAETLKQVEETVRKGVAPSSVVIDPGLGFALRNQDSWQIVEDLDLYADQKYPVLVGASRKRFVRERYGELVDQGTLDVTLRSVNAGVWGVRVHDVEPNVSLIAELTDRIGCGEGSLR